MEPKRRTSKRIANQNAKKEEAELAAALAAIAKMEAKEQRGEAPLQGPPPLPDPAQVAPLNAQEDPLPDLIGLELYMAPIDGGPLNLLVEDELALEGGPLNLLVEDELVVEDELALDGGLLNLLVEDVDDELALDGGLLNLVDLDDFFENEEVEQVIVQQQEQEQEQQVIVISSSSSSSSSSMPALEEVGPLNAINTPHDSSPSSGFNIPNDEETESLLQDYLDSQAKIKAFLNAIQEEKATMTKKVSELSSKPVVKVKSQELFYQLKEDGLTNIELLDKSGE